MKDIFTVSLADILPANLAQAPNIPPVIKALDPELRALSELSLSPALISDIDSSPSQALDHLAVTLASDLYGYAESDSSRREILRSSVIRHMKKGTAAEIIRALKTVGVNARFIPWWEFGGRPYTFRIEAGITGDYYKGRNITGIIARIVNESKSARSLLEKLDTNITASEKILLFTGTAESLSAKGIITLSRDELIRHDVIYYGVSRLISGGNVLPLNRDSALRTALYTGTASPAWISAEEWIDENTLQELLLQFEQRIFARIDSLEKTLNSKIDTQTRALNEKIDIQINALDEKINSQQRNLTAKIDAVIELLRWK